MKEAGVKVQAPVPEPTSKKLVYYDVVSDKVFFADVRREEQVYKFSKL